MSQNLRISRMLLCDYASMTKDGKMNIVGIFERLIKNKSPMGLNKAFLVATVIGEPNASLKVSLKAEHDNKNILPPTEFNSKLGPNGQNNLLIELQGVKLPEIGTYYFKIYDGNLLLGQTELEIVKEKGVSYEN